MNRPIKFICFNLDDEMVSPDYIDRKGVGWWRENSIPTCSSRLFQFTGLLDKDGKEIYFGHIVEWKLSPAQENSEVATMEVQMKGQTIVPHISPFTKIIGHITEDKNAKGKDL